jgi:mediator of RNA polymerase II transcription subunit 31
MSIESTLPENRFELELEFVQALASPAYLHFISTYRDGDGPVLLQDPQFLAYLKYLKDTWTRPEYSRFLSYPHALYFLELLCLDQSERISKEWTIPAFRNFCHQQQFLAWQYRHETLYGVGGIGSAVLQAEESKEADKDGPSTVGTTG